MAPLNGRGQTFNGHAFTARIEKVLIYVRMHSTLHYPGIPPASIALAMVTSLDQTSNCNLC